MDRYRRLSRFIKTFRVKQIKCLGPSFYITPNGNCILISRSRRAVYLYAIDGGNYTFWCYEIRFKLKSSNPTILYILCRQDRCMLLVFYALKKKINKKIAVIPNVSKYTCRLTNQTFSASYARLPFFRFSVFRFIFFF